MTNALLYPHGELENNIETDWIILPDDPAETINQYNIENDWITLLDDPAEIINQYNMLIDGQDIVIIEDYYNV